MIVVSILLGVALAASLAYNLGFLGGGSQPQGKPLPAGGGSSPSPSRAPDEDRARKAEAELEKRKKELDEARKSHAEVRDELKAAKKKLFDAGQSDKAGDDLAKARAEVERHASVQLETTRSELATALAEVQRLKAAEENRGKKRPAPERTEEKPVERPVERPQEVVQRVIRELSEVEKERIARLEQQSSNDRKKANELEREVRSAKARIDRIQRESKRVYGESNLARDKFRAVETRLNRTLLENDLLRRAVADLEKKTGQHAEHANPTPEELAESDRAMKEKHAAEDRAEAEARARLEAAPATVEEEPAAPAPSPVAEAPAAEAAPAPAADPVTPPSGA